MHISLLISRNIASSGRKPRFEDELGLNEDMDNISPFPVRHQKHPRGPIDDEIEEPKNEYHFGALSQPTSNAVSPSSWDHSAERGRIGGVGPAGSASMWDPGYGSGHDGIVGAGSGSASSHGYAAGSSAYGGNSATSPITSANSMPPSTNSSYPPHPSQSYSSQPYPPQPNPSFLPVPLPAGAVPLSARSDSTRGSGTAETAYNSRVPLMVANPDASSYTPYRDLRDSKNPQVYLQADAGYEIRGGAPAQAGSSSRPVVQHHDGGAVSQSGVSVRPVVQHQDGAAGVGGSVAAGSGEGDSALRRRRSTDKNQMQNRHRDAGDDEPAPPAYEA